jgi:hypothetical protein
MSQPALDELLKPFEPMRSVFLDLCDHLEARLVQYSGNLDDLTKRRLEMCLDGIRHPTVKVIAGEARPAFGALTNREGLTQLGGMGLMVNARLSKNADDIVESAHLLEAAGDCIAQYNFPAWLITSADIDDYHGVKPAISIANAGRHLAQRPASIPECRQERMAAYLHGIAHLSKGHIAPPTRWAAFDPREVRVYHEKKADQPGIENHNAWVAYGNGPDEDAKTRIVRLGPFPNTQLNGGQKEMVETMRKAFYHGSPEHGIAPLTNATPRQLEDNVRNGLVRLISEENPAWKDRYNEIASLADQFYAYVGEPHSMPSHQDRGVPSSAGAPGLA